MLDSGPSGAASADFKSAAALALVLLSVPPLVLISNLDGQSSFQQGNQTGSGVLTLTLHVKSWNLADCHAMNQVGLLTTMPLQAPHLPPASILELHLLEQLLVGLPQGRMGLQQRASLGLHPQGMSGPHPLQAFLALLASPCLEPNRLLQ